MSEKEMPPKEIPVGSLIIKGNSLVYENEALQINTLNAIWIDDLSTSVKHPFPVWVKILSSFAGVAAVIGILVQEPLLIVAGIAMGSVAIARFTKYVPSTKKAKFALGIEKASGERLRFPSANKQAIDQAADALFSSISNQKDSHITIVMNLSKKVPIKKSLGAPFVLKKKPAAGPKLYAKKDSEKLVKNVAALQPAEVKEPVPKEPPEVTAKEKEEPAEA